MMIVKVATFAIRHDVEGVYQNLQVLWSSYSRVLQKRTVVNLNAL